MLDKSLPMCYVLMVKEDTEVYPRYSLPDGYSFKFYEKGDEKTWVEIEMTVGQFQTMEEGLASFNVEFVEGHTLQPEERIFFVIDSNGKAVATGALWNGEWKGETKQRMHWIAVDESCKGKGIAKAIVDSPDEVTVVEAVDGKRVNLTLSVAEDDMGVLDPFESAAQSLVNMKKLGFG